MAGSEIPKGSGATVDESAPIEWPAVDVIVVAHNGGRALQTAVTSILASRGVRPNVLVVDNSSADGSIEALGTPPVRVIRLGRNVGYGAGFNAGLAQTNSAWVTCSNQDVIVEPDALQVMIRSLMEAEKETGDLAIAGPRIVRPDGSTTETCHSIPSLGQECQRLLYSARASRNVVATPGDVPGGWIRCGWVSGVFLVGRRAVFERIGGFDPDYFMYVEDLDLFRRARDAGAGCLWEPRVSVVHQGGIDPTTRGAVSGEMYALTLWNIRRYFEMHEPGGARFQGSAILGAGLVGASMRAVLWSGRALLSRWRPGNEASGTENASGLARMFATGAYLAGVALLTGRIPKRVRRKMGQQ